MNRIVDLRFDDETARHVTQALQIQAECGYERARNHLEEAGVPEELALRVLSIRFDRRRTSAPMTRRSTGLFTASAASAA